MRPIYYVFCMYYCRDVFSSSINVSSFAIVQTCTCDQYLRVHVLHVINIVILLSLNLYINFSGGYLSTKLLYGGKLLLFINTKFKVVNGVRSCIPKTMKMSTTDSLSYIFFLLFCLGFIRNSIEIFFEKICWWFVRFS